MLENKQRSSKKITSDRVAPPIIKTKIRCPKFLRFTADAFFKAESLQRTAKEAFRI